MYFPLVWPKYPVAEKIGYDFGPGWKNYLLEKSYKYPPFGYRTWEA